MAFVLWVCDVFNFAGFEILDTIPMNEWFWFAVFMFAVLTDD